MILPKYRHRRSVILPADTSPFAPSNENLTMSYQRFIDKVQQRAGLTHRDLAHTTVVATLVVLGERLREVDRRAIADQLPAELAEAMNNPGDTTYEIPVAADLETFIDRLAHHTTARVKVEQLRAVCQVLAETLNEQARTHLRIQPLNRLFAGTLH